MIKVISIIIINIMLCTTCQSQQYCENGSCVPGWYPVGQPNNYPKLTPVNNNQSPIPSPDRIDLSKINNRLNDLEKRLDTTSASIKDHLDAIAKAKATHVPLDKVINNLSSTVIKLEQNSQNAQVLIDRFESLINRNTNTIENQLAKDRKAITESVTTFSKETTDSLAVIKKNQSTLTERLNGYINIVNDLGTLGGKVRLLKYIAFGSLGVSGIGAVIGLYALKRIGPRVIKKVKGHRGPPLRRHDVRYNIPEHVQREYQTYTEKVVQNDNQHNASVEFPVNAPKQVTQPQSNYYPYQTNNFQEAYAKACSAAIKRYPGQELVLSYVDSVIQQELNGDPNVIK